MLLPVVLVVALCLGFSGWWRGAAAWLAGVGGALTVMLVLKLMFLACGTDQFLRSPSGHTAAAAVVCGGLMVVLADRRRWAVPTAVAAAALIGASRLQLGAHTPLEVVIGAAVGIGGAMVIAALAGPMPVFRRNRVAFAVLIVIALLHGTRMPAEAHIRHLAARVVQYFPACEMQ